MAALMLRSPELVISKDEATKLAEALRNLMQYYSITPDPRVMAWLQLIGVAAVIYGPRAVLMSQRARAARAQRERGAVPPSMSVVNPTEAPQANRVPGAFESPPPPPGVFKFQ